MFSRPLDFRNLPPGVKFLLTANLVGFSLQWIFSLVGGPSLVRIFALTPLRVTETFWVWQVVTYMFLHGGFFHILFNAFMLWTLGRQLEDMWGTKGFLGYYFLCGLGAAGLNLLLEPHSPLPVVGASGAIYGMLVAFALMFPMAVFYVYFIIPMRAWQAVTLFAVIEFLIGLSASQSRLANIAHLGGMLTGFLYLKAPTFRFSLRSWWGQWEEKREKKQESRHQVAFHELGQEVDRILEKISKQGLQSLTREEKDLMERYSRSKSKNQP